MVESVALFSDECDDKCSDKLFQEMWNCQHLINLHRRHTRILLNGISQTRKRSMLYNPVVLDARIEQHSLRLAPASSSFLDARLGLYVSGARRVAASVAGVPDGALKPFMTVSSNRRRSGGCLGRRAVVGSSCPVNSYTTSPSTPLNKGTKPVVIPFYREAPKTSSSCDPLMLVQIQRHSTFLRYCPEALLDERATPVAPTLSVSKSFIWNAGRITS